MDGRRETAYDSRAYDQNLDFKFGHGDWDALLREYDTHLALVRRFHPSDNLLRLKPGWALLYEDPLAALFGRADLPYLDRIRSDAAPVRPPRRCGPLHALSGYADVGPSFRRSTEGRAERVIPREGAAGTGVRAATRGEASPRVAALTPVPAAPPD